MNHQKEQLKKFETLDEAKRQVRKWIMSKEITENEFKELILFVNENFGKI
jgi:hypothetical protein